MGRATPTHGPIRRGAASGPGAVGMMIRSSAAGVPAATRIARGRSDRTHGVVTVPPAQLTVVPDTERRAQ
eukprot:150687-Hanusia_phi.AAC.1